MDIKKLVEAEKDTLIAFRRHFHEHPELSQHEFKTMDFIEEKLHAWGIETVRVPHGGIFGTIDSGKPGWTVLMRADIDALPIQESETNLGKKKICLSQNPGVSHACGHDGHMAMLLTAAKILAAHKGEWEGKVLLMFEEAEELGERGIGPLMRYLADHKVHVDACYGTHVMFCLPAGKVAVLSGPALAGAFFYQVKLHGKSGHGSRPDLAVSPIDCFTAFSAALQSYRMRRVAPNNSLTYSFGMVQAGDTPNVIPDTLTFAGTARCFNNDDGLAFREAFLKLLKSSADNFGCKAEVLVDQYFPVTYNNPEYAAFARKAIEKDVGDVVETIEPWMASETFSITESLYPGMFMFTGIKDDKVGSGGNHHTPEFDIAESGLVTGAEAALSYVLALLRDKPAAPSFKKKDLESMVRLTEVQKPRML